MNYYHNILHDDMRNGPGLRVVLFLSGCSHHCVGCHNPQTWDPKSGIEFDQSAWDEIMEQLSKSYIKGITFSGGDPLNPLNQPLVRNLCEYIRKVYPDKNIWVYTGYTFEELKSISWLGLIDVIVDGEFVKELADVTYHWAGSTNQRVIDVQQSLKQNKVILYAE